MSMTPAPYSTDDVGTVLDAYEQQARRFTDKNGGQRPVLVIDAIEFLQIPEGKEDALWRVLITRAKVRFCHACS